MLLEGLHLYLALIRVFETKTRILPFYLFSYGFPAVIVGVTASVAWDDYGSDNGCLVYPPAFWAVCIPGLAVILVLKCNFCLSTSFCMPSTAGKRDYPFHCAESGFIDK
ncbi:unnamed protein product [Cylicostephanus goldi]|uniref:G-protein coupled receptors family 2 profile 2 domain-containing protein n=1 Tax=Cylicostephanus goldi TaxID=71465 RepID=A0A3P6UPX6_CYLGO|nr:unnamed protein product [Cylicostephanus goldi]